MDEASAQGAMERILQAIQPDVLAMSEVEDFSADFVRDLLDAWMPLTEGSWHVAKDDWDLIVASRWPIDATYPEVPVAPRSALYWASPVYILARHDNILARP